MSISGLRRGSIVAALTVLVGVASARAQTPPAQTAPAPLHVVPTTPENIGQVPSHFFWIRQGLQAAQDPVDGQLVFFDDQGHIVGRTALPQNFDIGEIVAEGGDIRLIDTQGSRQVTVPRTIEPASTRALAPSPIAPNGGARALRLTRRSAQELVYHDERRGGRPLEIRSLAGGTLAQAYEIGQGTDDTRYIVSEEITGASPGLDVKVFVQRFDRAGNLTGIAYVPLDGLDVVPRDFLTVTGEGTVRALLPTADGVTIRELTFSAPPGQRGGKLDSDRMRALIKPGKSFAVDTTLPPMNRRAAVFRQGEPTFRVTVPTPPITREQTLVNARAFLNVDWVMTAENFSKPEIENRCVPTAGKFWLRPHHYNEALIGTVIGPMPYRWGGEDTPMSFKLRMETGALAGDICTCRDPALDYCLMPESAGVDCSGLVSRAWGIDKRGTSGLLDVSTQLRSYADLRPGDAFDWPGRHVRLLVDIAQGAAIAYTVIESSTRLECEGVCERTYRPSELYGYRLLRYRGMQD